MYAVDRALFTTRELLPKIRGQLFLNPFVRGLRPKWQHCLPNPKKSPAPNSVIDLSYNICCSTLTTMKTRITISPEKDKQMADWFARQPTIVLCESRPMWMRIARVVIISTEMQHLMLKSKMNMKMNETDEHNYKITCEGNEMYFSYDLNLSPMSKRPIGVPQWRAL